MKLVYAIVRNDNEDDVVSQLTQHHYSVTRLSTTGGFLKKGNTTLMIGAEDDKVQEVIDVIKQECGQHQKLTVNMPYQIPESADRQSCGPRIFCVFCASRQAVWLSPPAGPPEKVENKHRKTSGIRKSAIFG